MRFQLIQQRNAEAIEAALEALTQQVSDNTVLLNEIRAAQLLAQSANDTATSVSNSVTLTASYPTPSDILTASSSGSILISAHTRVYGNTSVAVNAGSVSGFAPGDYVQVFYDDAARAGGAVTYQGTTDLISQSGSTHIVGGVTIPQEGEPPAQGQPTPPPGYVPNNPATA